MRGRPSFMNIGLEILELWEGVESRSLPLTKPVAYATACTTVLAVMMQQAQAT